MFIGYCNFAVSSSYTAICWEIVRICLLQIWLLLLFSFLSLHFHLASVNHSLYSNVCRWIFIASTKDTLCNVNGHSSECLKGIANGRIYYCYVHNALPSIGPPLSHTHPNRGKTKIGPEPMVASSESARLNDVHVKSGHSVKQTFSFLFVHCWFAILWMAFSNLPKAFTISLLGRGLCAADPCDENEYFSCCRSLHVKAFGF